MIASEEDHYVGTGFIQEIPELPHCRDSRVELSRILVWRIGKQLRRMTCRHRRDYLTHSDPPRLCTEFRAPQFWPEARTYQYPARRRATARVISPPLPSVLPQVGRPPARTLDSPPRLHRDRPQQRHPAGQALP